MHPGVTTSKPPKATKTFPTTKKSGKDGKTSEIKEKFFSASLTASTEKIRPTVKGKKKDLVLIRLKIQLFFGFVFTLDYK